MKFSDYFNITTTSDDDWFDPILSVDTRLFLDPFLLYADETGHFLGSHDEIIAFFNSVFKFVARAGGNQKSVLWRKAVDSLLFREVEELCLGYTQAGTRGSGSGRIIGNIITGALWEAVKAGIKELKHFEEVGILQEGIGADRISDATAGMIRHRLATYTQEICERHQIPVETIRYLSGVYDLTAERWSPLKVKLPINPYNQKPILLVPRRYLRDLPTINADDFWDYCYTNENETLRNEFSYDVTRNVAKSSIVAFARRHPELREEYISSCEQRSPAPYDLARDNKGLIQWYDATASYCQENPVSLDIASENKFYKVVDNLVETFKHYVEENRGWNLLWNENKTARREAASQDLFLGIVKHYCQANNIDISREPNIGRGPVDFKTSQGYEYRALLEVKLAKNTRFWNGLERQLPKYQDAEQVKVGYFIIIVYSHRDTKKLTEIKERVKVVNEKTGYNIKSVVVDARRSISASKL